MATNKPGESGPAFPKSPKPVTPEMTEVVMPNIPPKPMTPSEQRADDRAEEMVDPKEPHPEHVAGKVAVKQFEARTEAEQETGKKAVEKHPHRFNK